MAYYNKISSEFDNTEPNQTFKLNKNPDLTLLYMDLFSCNKLVN